MSRMAALAFGVLTVAFGGCGSDRVPATGRVNYGDGSPVEEGTVIGEATIEGKPVSLQGMIRPDGTFDLGTTAPGDGALPGSYRFIIMPRALGDAELAEGKKPAVDGKYTNFESSGLRGEVLKTEKNHFEFKVEKPRSNP